MPTLSQNLAQLYPGQENEIEKRIKKITDDFKARIKEKNLERINDSLEKRKSGHPLFDEKDVMLICYADHVQEKNIKTFQTMNKFLSERVKGVINKIHFLPFYPYSSDDGFSVVDYYEVKKEYGNWSDVGKIDQDFGFMFDLVLNHASVQGECFQKFLAGDKKYKDFFIAFDEEIDTSQVFRPRSHPLLTPFETNEGKKFVWTTFSDDQADLNYANPEVLLEMIKILLFYIENGAEAIRLDAVAYCWKDKNFETSCFNIPEDHTLMQIFNQVFRKAAPHAWIISETVLPHKKNIEFFGDGKNEAHLVYNFVLETLLLHTFLEKDSSLATEYLGKIDYNSFSKENSFLNLSVSHDGIHVIPGKEALDEDQMMAVAKDLEKKNGQVLYRTVEGGEEKVEPYEFNVTYPSALNDSEEFGVKKFIASQSIQLALKGVPLIYFNNLIGAPNWNEGVEKFGYGRAINREKFDYSELNERLDDPNHDQHKIFEGFMKLIKTRIAEPLFSPLVDQKIVDLGNGVVAILRYNEKGEKLLAITNVTDKKIGVDDKKIKKILEKDSIKDLISGKELDLKNKLEMKAYDILWLK